MNVQETETQSKGYMPHLLLLQAAPDDTGLVLRQLEDAGYQVRLEHVSDEKDVRTVITADRWDLVISDYWLNPITVLDVLRIVREHTRDLPVLIVAEPVGEEQAVEAIKAGACDFILKSNSVRLIPAIKRELYAAAQRIARFRTEERVQMLSNALTQSANLVVITDLHGTIIYVNEAFSRTMGYQPQDVIGKPARMLRSESMDDEIVQAITITVVAGREWRGEVLNRRSDGSQFWVRATVSPMRDPAGNVSHFIAIQEDITDRKRLEEEIQRYTEQLEQMVEARTDELRRAKEQLEVILSHSSDGIVFALATGDIQATNPAFRDLFGDRVERTVEEIVHLLMSPAEVEEIASAIVSVLYENRNTRTQARIQRQDGKPIDIDLAFTPVELHEAHRPGMILSVRDITPLREAERFKAQFVANAAHDLGNPIATLKTQLYMLKTRPERMSTYIEMIERQTRRLENLITELRTLSDIDRGLAMLDMDTVDLNELVGSVVSENQALAGSHKHRLSFVPVAGLPPVLGDRNKMVRVVANLISNAIDYTHDGGEITIATYHTIDEVGFTIRDTGIGMTEREQAQIFDRFFRSEQAKTIRSEGTGLGLAIVREMIEAHGGTIHVSSALGKGSEFRVSLPIKRL